MKSHELTNRAAAATNGPMQGTRLKVAQRYARSADRRLAFKSRLAIGVLAGGVIALGGCVSVNAPDKPIVIELNINIKQEVIYRLAADAGNTIKDNPAIF